jgi:hypothetical protein
MSFTSKLLRSAWKANRIERALDQPGAVREAEGEVEGDERNRVLASLAKVVAGLASAG